ncbi:unnamed protein product [Porites evermanni]|uniref:SAP domain-containing protein n=1 Tax=Porites evermanni TaxID=104178 RepID=A0ABN8LVV6_9CNID|nr:unnamed protein product [Porites evermanni]
MGCKMSKKMGRKGRTTKHKQTIEEIEATSAPLQLGDFPNMKRPQLQKLCKQLGLKATGKNVELIERLQEYQKEVTVSSNNNETSAPPSSPTSSTEEVENGKECLDNVTFEIVDSKIPTDEHVHIGKSDYSASEGADEEVCSNPMDNNNCDFPDSTSTDHKEEQKTVTVSKADSHSETVLRELNCRVTLTDAKPNHNKAKINACTRWCVVEGLLKQDMKTQWRKIHLLGGKPMISNSFGKRVPFVLEPSGLNTPDDYDDNYICGTCVRDNETALRWKGSSRMVHSTVTQREAINQEASVTCSTPTSPNHSILTSFSRVGSVKRKRSDNSNTSFANSSADSDQMDRKRRKENTIRSGSNTPASPQVRRARGEELLPRNLHKPWRPRKLTKTASQTQVKEDTDFAKRVEEIIKNTQPGSEEEMHMIMSSKSNRIQRSPTKK